MKKFKICVRYFAVTAICLCLIALFVLIPIIRETIAEDALSAEVPQDTVLEIASIIPLRTGLKPDDVATLYKKGETAFANIEAVDRRTFAAAYSENLDPAYPPHEDDIAVNKTWWGPMEFVICIGTCVEINETSQKPRETTYKYTIEIDEIVYQNEMLPGFEKISYSETVSKDKKIFEAGKQYLFWGYYSSARWGSYQFEFPFFRRDGMKETFIEQNGRHLLREGGMTSPDLVPFVSELNSTLDEFLQTKIGMLWQTCIFAKIDVIEHSVTVIGTDYLESIPAFNSGDCSVIEGDEFAAEHYQNGERVCVISDELAELNGLKVGDTLPLKVYMSDYDYEKLLTMTYISHYDPLAGFAEEGEWQIIGIYHSDYEVNGDYDIHPNTVFLPNQSLTKTYKPTYDAKYPDICLSYILPEGGWNAFEQEATSLGYAGWFVYGDGGKSEVLEENNRRQTALTEWQAAVETWCKPLPTVSTVLMAVAMLVFVLSKKKEIGRLYAIETPKRTLFVHFFVQTTIVGAVAFGLALLLSPPILSRIVPTVLRDLADPTYADILMAGVPEESLSLTPILGKQALIYVIISALCAAIGACRRYQFEYHDEKE